MCVTYCNATLNILATDVANAVDLSADHKQKCKLIDWTVPTSNRILVDFQSHKTITGMYHQQSKMELQHFRDNNDVENVKVFTFEYLEPFSNGTCSQYTNCLHCLTDSLCGWCELTSKCVSRSEDETESCMVNDDWRYLTLLPSACSNCSNYISCERCVESGLCEWWVDDARCMRLGETVRISRRLRC